jgi:hypothetical protein
MNGLLYGLGALIRWHLNDPKKPFAISPYQLFAGYLRDPCSRQKPVNPISYRRKRGLLESELYQRHTNT